MTPQRGWAWVLAVALSVPSGALAAAPDECLSYRANTEVASCANRYAPGTSAPKTRPAAWSTPPRALQARANDGSELRAVPVLRASAKAEPPPEPAKPTFDVDRELLTNTIIAGAIGGSMLILVAFGFWRWGATLTKSCPYCSAKMGRNARACRSCFRAV